MIALIAGIALLFFRMRMKALNARTELLQKRTQLARELHDTLAQSFSGTLIRLEVAARMVPEGAVQLHEQLQTAQRLTRESLDEVRAVVAQLREEPTDKLILNELLEARAQRQLDGTGVELEVHRSGPPLSLSAVVTHNLCRIVDEAISNALLHAATPKILLRIETNTNEVTISVTDFGQKPPPSAALRDRAGHNGIRGIYERATEIGPTLLIDRTAIGGWQLCINLALQRREGESP